MGPREYSTSADVSAAPPLAALWGAGAAAAVLAAVKPLAEVAAVSADLQGSKIWRYRYGTAASPSSGHYESTLARHGKRVFIACNACMQCRPFCGSGECTAEWPSRQVRGQTIPRKQAIPAAAFRSVLYLPGVGRGGCLPLLAGRWGSASCVEAVARVAVVGGGQGQDLQAPLPLRDLLHKAVQLAEAARLYEAHHTDLHSSRPVCSACSGAQRRPCTLPPSTHGGLGLQRQG